LKRIINSISFLVTLSVALLLLASAVVIYVRPERIHVFTFMGILFPAVWILNVIFLMVHGLRMKKRALIPLFVILLTWTQWTNIFQWSGSQAPEKMNQPVKVMTYNARMFDFYNWSGQPGILDAILDFIRKENPDVLCVQEFFTSTREEKYIPHRIIARLNTLGFRHIEYSVKGPRDSGYGIATFSRFPIVNKGKLRFENSKNMSIFTDVDISGKVVRIFNNHLESIGLEASEYKTLDSLNFQINEKQNNGLKKIFQKMSRAFRFRSDQAETVARHIDNSPYPVLVCGDFNDTPVSYVYRTMRGDLKDAFRESGSGFGGTYHGRLPSLRIDYIFYAPQFSVYDFHTFKVPYSDHYPIMCTIELAPEGGP
jgi:endonuclease/exonuclease/phosphatase family metal-dependent hydrolase